MKLTLLLIIFSTFLFSCSNNAQNTTIEQAKKTAAIIKQMQPGGISTTENGWKMTAIIDGKRWSASSIIEPDMAGRILGDANEIKIGLPYNRSNMIAGRKTTFSHEDATDIFLPADEGGILGGYKGEMLITKADEQWAEGTFHFFASSERSDKRAEVTDGFFRISMANPQK